MNTITPKQKLSRAIWLAFQASTPLGYGFLHAAEADKQTEESLFRAYNPKNEDRVYLDYAFGRMMKTRFSIEGNNVVISPEEPRLDYQSWGGKYFSAADILKDVEESFN